MQTKLLSRADLAAVLDAAGVLDRPPYDGNRAAILSGARAWCEGESEFRLAKDGETPDPLPAGALGGQATTSTSSTATGALPEGWTEKSPGHFVHTGRGDE